MKFNKLTPNLMVEDVARTLDYYLDVLGFEFVMGVAPGSRQAVTSYTRAVTLDFAIMRREFAATNGFAAFAETKAERKKRFTLRV